MSLRVKRWEGGGKEESDDQFGGVGGCSHSRVQQSTTVASVSHDKILSLPSTLLTQEQRLCAPLGLRTQTWSNHLLANPDACPLSYVELCVVTLD